jgi:hypothetical protein
MSLLALILWAVISGSTVVEYWKQPLDYDRVNNLSIQAEQPMLEWKATRYDYQLWDIRWSKNHNTCALRIKERYSYYKVCSKDTGKCVECYHNDYWPAEYTNKVIDLSSHAFKELWIPLSRWVAEVQIYKLDKNGQ